MSFINFFVKLLKLDQYDSTYVYAPWYDGAGSIVGALVPVVTSLVFVFLFYFVWSRFRATTTFHWCIAGIVNMIVAFLLNLFIGKASLANYIYEQGDEFQDIWYTVSTWPFSTDLWIFAINGVCWAAVFYFVFSIIFKRWSPVFNIPFGKKMKARN